MEILEELPIEQWPNLQKKLKKFWPLNLPGFYILHMNLRYPEVRETLKFKIYCPNGNMDNGFVGIIARDMPEIVIFSITEDTSKIQEALLKTNLIDWSKMVLFGMVTSLTRRTLEEVRSVMQFKRFYESMAKMYHLEPTVPFEDLIVPDNTYLRSVKTEHIQRVNDTWTYKSSNTHIYFATLVSNGLSYGLYSTDTEELLAWIFINESGYFCHFYCEEKYRRRGYGEYVLKCATNAILKEGHDVYAYVVPNNNKPLGLFTKLGFKAADDSAFILIENAVNTLKC